MAWVTVAKVGLGALHQQQQDVVTLDQMYRYHQEQLHEILRTLR